MKRFLLYSTLIALTLAFTGCSKQKLPDGLPQLVPATVSITQDGAPLEGATILFYASDPSLLKWGVSGCTDATGKATMAVNGKYKGSPVGNFQVTVTKMVTDDDKVEIPASPDPNADPEGFNEWRKKYVDRPIMNKEYSLIEAKYTLLESTPLKAEVKQQGPNSYTFDVGKAVKVEMKYDH